MGLHAEISARELSKWRRLEEELKMTDAKIKKCNLGPSALFTGVNHYLSAELIMVIALSGVQFGLKSYA